MKALFSPINCVTQKSVVEKDGGQLKSKLGRLTHSVTSYS